VGIIPDMASIPAKRPYLVIAIWIVALVSLYPFFASLESLTSAAEESLLPRDSESSKASSLLSMISGGSRSDIIYVSNINISDPRTALNISKLIYSIDISGNIRSIGGYPQAVTELYRNVENISNISIVAASIGTKDLLELTHNLEKNLSITISGFKNISQALLYIREALTTIDANFTYAVDLAYRFSRNISNYENGLRNIDKIYSELYWQANNYSKRVSILREGLIDSDVNRDNISTLYLFTWWQTARTVYYFNISGTEYIAYTNLTTIDPNLAPLPPDIAYTLYRGFANLTGLGVHPDIAISRLASEILMPRILGKYIPNASEEEILVLIEIVSRAWQDIYGSLSTCLYCSLSPPDQNSSHIISQISLLNKMLSLSDRLSSRIKDNGGTYLEDIVYRAIVSQGVSEDLAKSLARIIVHGNVTTRYVAEIVIREATKYMSDLSGYSAYISEIIVLLDPDARGSIWGNRDKAVEALSLLVARMGNIDYSVARAIVDLGYRNASKEDIIPVIRSYISIAAENMSKGVLKASDISYILEKYDPNATGALARIAIVNATVDLFLITSKGTPYGEMLSSIPASLLESLARGEDPVYIAKTFFLLQALEKIQGYLGSNRYPQKSVESLKELVSYIVNTYPNQTTENIYMYIVNITSISIEEEAMERGYTINASYSELISKLALQVALGELRLEEAVENASNKIFGDLYRSTLDILIGKIVGEGGKSFIVIYTPTGSDPYVTSKDFFSKVSNAIKKEYPEASILWTGSNVIDEDLKRISSEDVARISRVSEILVFVVLLAILGSVAAVILPYAGIVLGVVVGGGIAFFIASGGIADMLSLTRTLIYVIPLGLGSDYAAYLVYRFREEYAKLGDARKASEEALRRAGPAIVASALTVIAGFGSLALGWEFPLFRSLGIYMPLVVAVTAASCLTLVPAILSIAGGSRKFWWGVRKSIGIDSAQHGVSRVSRTFIGMGPVMPIVFAIISITSIAVYPVITFSHDLRLFLPSNSPSIAALDTIASDMGYGQVFPSYIVVVKGSTISIDDLLKIEDLASKISSIGGVQSVEGPTRPFGTPVNISTVSIKDPAVSAYISNNIAYMRVVIKYNTFSSEAVDLIERIREMTKRWASSNGYSVYIGGATATSEELDRLVNNLFWYRVLPFAIITMILIFALVFGSFLASILAVLLVILSSLISMVLTGVIFNNAFSSPVLWFLPQVIFTAMLGVGMDYNSFYMARAREICLAEGECNSRGVARASGIVGRLIMGLAMVMAAAFGSLMLSSSIGLREIGFSLLVSVLLVASAVSYLVLPPTLSIIGKRMWMKKILI
jgi:uncharacterized membrane protein YdfJ with MMPL/SSD domain